MRYDYWLANTPGFGAAKIRHLYEYAHSAEEIFFMPLSQIKKIEGLTQEDIRSLHRHQRHWELEKEWFSLMEEGIGFLSQEDEAYPEKLRHIPNPPFALYYIGNLPDFQRKSIAIVGSRGRSAYGSEVAEKMGEVLAKHGVQVISGLAKGIDTDAHRGALKAGDTFAVLGSGVNVCYPKENKYLYARIIEHGGIISEYPPNAEALARQFPARNRIISGLSDCVVVIEAREKSGSLITADFAMEQGKDVYALPGRITDPLSTGCNQLIKQGAGVIKSIDDFLMDLEILSENTYTQIDFRKNLLEKDERLVYSLTDFRPVGLSTLVEKTNISIGRLMEIIEKLKAQGLIKETFTNYYVRSIFK